MGKLVREKKWDLEKLMLPALLVAVGVILRMINLAERPVWYDETITIYQAKSSFTYILSHFFHGSNPPFSYLVYRFWFLIFGDSQLAWECVSVLFGAGSLIMIYRVGNRLLGSGGGLVSLILLTFSSYHVFVSQQIRGYSLAVFLVLVSIDLVISVNEKCNQKTVMWWLVSVFLMLSTHFYTFFIAAAECLLVSRLWVQRRLPWRITTGVYYAIGGVLVLGVAALGYWTTRAIGLFPIYGRPAASLKDVGLVLQSIFFLSRPLVCLSVVIVSWALIREVSTRSRGGQERAYLWVLITWFVLSIFIPLLLSRDNNSFFYVRYYIFTHVTWVLLTAFGILKISNQTIRKSILLVFVVGLSFILADYFQESQLLSSRKKLYQQIEREYRPGDVIVHENGWTFGPSHYYHGGRLQEYFLSREFGIPTQEHNLANVDKIGGFRRLWLLWELPSGIDNIRQQSWFLELPTVWVRGDINNRWALYELKR